MKPDSACLQEELHDWLLGCGFSQHSQAETGCVYHRESDSTCLLIDTVICRLADYPYVAYTTTQNKFVFSYDRVFRFLFDEDDLLSALQEEISLFLDGDSDPETIRRFGGNRTEQEPDPTLPEATFEDCFLQAFGDRARMGLHREFAYIDLDGVTRYIDYALFSSSAKFAIELNGESWHHPVMIGPNRYRSQLFKQNSLVADGFRVFRWSLNGMRDRERFILELQRFLGDSRPFLDKSIIKVPRELFTLRNHQRDALAQLDDARKQGRHAFLLVLPTGTGKTEIFIEDLVRVRQQAGSLRALIVVPTRKLREQTPGPTCASSSI